MPELDDELRASLQGAFPLGRSAAASLEAIGPAMRSARRRENARHAMVTAVVLLLAGFGGVSLFNGGTASEDVPVAAVAPDEEQPAATEEPTPTSIPLADPASPSVTDAEDPVASTATAVGATDTPAETDDATVAVGGGDGSGPVISGKTDATVEGAAEGTGGATDLGSSATTPTVPTTSPAGSTPAQTPGTVPPGPTVVPASPSPPTTPTSPTSPTTTPTTPPTVEPSTPTTTVVSTTVPTTTEPDEPTTTTSEDSPTTTIQIDYAQTLVSDCGLISVGVGGPDGDDIVLLDTLAPARFTTTVRDEGPRRVVVIFDDDEADERCEMRAEVVDGEIELTNRLK